MKIKRIAGDLLSTKSHDYYDMLQTVVNAATDLISPVLCNCTI